MIVPENQYIYAVARIRSKELKLLDRVFIEQLIAASSYKEAIRLLRDRGWGDKGEESLEELLTFEREKTWNLIRELVGDISLFDAILCQNDYHNLKAAIKQVYLDKEIPDIFLAGGTVDLETIIRAVSEHNFTSLPEHMSGCANESYGVLFHTGNSQLADAIIDKACLDAVYAKGMASGNEAIMEYAELKVALSDILIAVRGHEAGRGSDFFKRTLAQCKTLDAMSLGEAAFAGLDAICGYLKTTCYSGAADALRMSTVAFEVWGDSLIISHMKRQKYNPFTASPLVAYVLARENEIKTVTIILKGKLYGLADKAIRERMRDMYV
ncbi:hypothetical protein EAL2_808p05280 (plasmid) [Peptoclostridium acidaminophilum DSM 3953]|uniref:V-type ATP synthase subunit C n=1 Tax=Peptoclostridium acidaminophilum DSM 3953 TaxID=1286171 RepID=W8UB66_PEPAC|nr:V-type ATPase subunit [Peptoclostridium acidaminophilum]AHM58031.1 hypothetical protein EAL2_808p05280 [Peptoclostridium acidaminophilum DSM 3953]